MTSSSFYSRGGKRYLGIQVKTLSKRAPVPLGTSLENLFGDFWIIISKVTLEPSAFIVTPDEVKRLAHRGERNNRVSYWLQAKDYEIDAFREAWQRIGRG